MALACGLDFGTSNSTLGLVGANGPQLLALEGEQPTIPSVLFFSFEDDLLYFGRSAIAEYVGGAEGRLMRSLKSVLGTALFEDATRIKAKRLGFGEIIGSFVGELKRRAEAQLDEGLTAVVMGRPVQFVDDDPAADKAAQDQLEAAVRAQGFREVVFQYEPIAAALDYERQASAEKLALIVDLGGGTSDFSLVRVAPGRSSAHDRSGDILATGGVHIGGTDFDRLLSMAHIMPELGLGTLTRDGKRHLPVAPYVELSTWHRINRLNDPQALRDLRSTIREAAEPDPVRTMVMLVEDRLGHQLVGAVEEAKIALSNAPDTDFTFPVRDRQITARVTEDNLSTALAASIRRIEGTIAAMLAQAGVGADRVDSLILTGGSTLVPAVTRKLRALFPDAEIVRTNVLGSVGLGLALEAERVFGPSDGRR